MRLTERWLTANTNIYVNVIRRQTNSAHYWRGTQCSQLIAESNTEKLLFTTKSSVRDSRKRNACVLELITLAFMHGHANTWLFCVLVTYLYTLTHELMPKCIWCVCLCLLYAWHRTATMRWMRHVNRELISYSAIAFIRPVHRLHIARSKSDR